MTTPVSPSPAADPQPTSWATPNADDYRPDTSRTALAITAACLVALSEVVEAVLIVPASDEMIRIDRDAGTDVSPDWAGAYYVASLVTFILIVMAYVATCLWLWRARQNSEALAPGHRHTRARGWVWGGWVVPIVSLWFPFNVVRDIADATHGAEGRGRPSRRTLALWWATWLAYVVTVQVISRLIAWNGDPGPSAARALVWVEMVNAILCLVALVFWVAVIRGVHRSQQLAAEALTPTPPEGVPLPGRGGGGAAWALVVVPVLAVAGFALAASVAVVAVYEGIAEGSTATSRDSGTSGAASSPNHRATYIEDLHEGDCVAKALSAGAVPETVDVVPCEHRHAHEVYAVVDLPSGPFPGETIVSRLADHRCTTEFRDFDGISIDRSVLDILFMYPTDAQQWSYHRSVICMASGAAPTSHSYAGTHH